MQNSDQFYATTHKNIASFLGQQHHIVVNCFVNVSGNLALFIFKAK
jgi:hypothetical protein